MKITRRRLAAGGAAFLMALGGAGAAAMLSSGSAQATTGGTLYLINGTSVTNVPIPIDLGTPLTTVLQDACGLASLLLPYYQDANIGLEYCAFQPGPGGGYDYVGNSTITLASFSDCGSLVFIRPSTYVGVAPAPTSC